MMVKPSHSPSGSTSKATLKKMKEGISKKTKVLPDLEEAKQVTESSQSSFMIDESENVNQKNILMHRLAKAKYQLEKRRKENLEKEMTLAMCEYMQSKELLENLTIADAKDIDMPVDQYIEDNENRKVDLAR